MAIADSAAVEAKMVMATCSVEPFGSDKISSLLQRTLANNKVLELEVRNLARKVCLFLRLPTFIRLVLKWL